MGGMDHEDGERGGYLVLMRCDNRASSFLWTGNVIEIEPTADCTITLSRVVVSLNTWYACVVVLDSVLIFHIQMVVDLQPLLISTDRS